MYLSDQASGILVGQRTKLNLQKTNLQNKPQRERLDYTFLFLVGFQ